MSKQPEIEISVFSITPISPGFYPTWVLIERCYIISIRIKLSNDISLACNKHTWTAYQFHIDQHLHLRQLLWFPNHKEKINIGLFSFFQSITTSSSSPPSSPPPAPDIITTTTIITTTIFIIITIITTIIIIITTGHLIIYSTIISIYKKWLPHKI